MTNSTEYKTSRKSFSAEIATRAGDQKEMRHLRSVAFLYSDDEKTFYVRAHKHEYSSAMKIVNETEFCMSVE